ncbi:MAG TPA: PaaI family thioesterase [Acidimicrobiia bacterium]|nr:PaaI family thioesterase [Acidimicrobiia bacterium]
MNQAMSRVQAVFALAPFIREVGYELADAGPGWVETRLRVEPRHLQQHGYLHAGVITTMADHTAGGAASTVVQPGQSVLTSDLSIQLLRPGRGEELRCRGEVVKPGRTLVFTQADVWAEAVHVARLHATMAVVNEDLG